MPASSMRIAKAFLVAPLVAPILYFLLTLPIGARTTAQIQLALHDIFTFGLVLSFVGAVVFGLPILVVLIRFHMTRLPIFAAFGTLIGMFVIYILVGEAGGSTFLLVRLVLIGGVCGLASACTFWHLAIRGQAEFAKAAEPTAGNGNRSEAQLT